MGIGAVIGGITGGGAALMSEAGASATAVGMAGGAFYNGSMTVLAGGNPENVMNAMFNGAMSGGIGAFIGASIGGGLGEFASGSVGSGLNAWFNRGNGEEVGTSALIGGITSFGFYHLSSYLTWQFGGGKNFGGVRVSYKQYTTMQADFQRSRFNSEEYGGILNRDGSVTRIPKEARGDLQTNYDFNRIPGDARGVYHTHWAKPGIQFDVIPGTGNIIGKYTGQGEIWTTQRYHTSSDLSYTKPNSIVINRYDSSISLTPGTYSIYRDHMIRYMYSFFIINHYVA